MRGSFPKGQVLRHPAGPRVPQISILRPEISVAGTYAGS